MKKICKILSGAMMGILLLEMIVFSPKLMNYRNPDLDNMHVTPSDVVKQIQKDVE